GPARVWRVLFLGAQTVVLQVAELLRRDRRRRSDATPLLRPAAVVGHRRHIGNRVDADAERGQRTHRRLAPRARALDADVAVLDDLLLRGAGGDLPRPLARGG